MPRTVANTQKNAICFATMIFDFSFISETTFLRLLNPPSIIKIQNGTLKNHNAHSTFYLQIVHRNNAKFRQQNGNPGLSTGELWFLEEILFRNSYFSRTTTFWTAFSLLERTK